MIMRSTTTWIFAALSMMVVGSMFGMQEQIVVKRKQVTDLQISLTNYTYAHKKCDAVLKEINKLTNMISDLEKKSTAGLTAGKIITTGTGLFLAIFTLFGIYTRNSSSRQMSVDDEDALLPTITRFVSKHVIPLGIGATTSFLGALLCSAKKSSVEKEIEKQAVEPRSELAEARKEYERLNIIDYLSLGIKQEYNVLLNSMEKLVKKEVLDNDEREFVEALKEDKTLGGADSKAFEVDKRSWIDNDNNRSCKETFREFKQQLLKKHGNKKTETNNNENVIHLDGNKITKNSLDENKGKKTSGKKKVSGYGKFVEECNFEQIKYEVNDNLQKQYKNRSSNKGGGLTIEQEILWQNTIKMIEEVDDEKLRQYYPECFKTEYVTTQELNKEPEFHIEEAFSKEHYKDALNKWAGEYSNSHTKTTRHKDVFTDEYYEKQKKEKLKKNDNVILTHTSSIELIETQNPKNKEIKKTVVEKTEKELFNEAKQDVRKKLKDKMTGCQSANNDAINRVLARLDYIDLDKLKKKCPNNWSEAILELTKQKTIEKDIYSFEETKDSYDTTSGFKDILSDTYHTGQEISDLLSVLWRSKNIEQMVKVFESSSVGVFKKDSNKISITFELLSDMDQIIYDKVFFVKDSVEWTREELEKNILQKTVTATTKIKNNKLLIEFAWQAENYSEYDVISKNIQNKCNYGVIDQKSIDSAKLNHNWVPIVYPINVFQDNNNNENKELGRFVVLQNEDCNENKTTNVINNGLSTSINKLNELDDWKKSIRLQIVNNILDQNVEYNTLSLLEMSAIDLGNAIEAINKNKENNTEQLIFDAQTKKLYERLKELEEIEQEKQKLEKKHQEIKDNKPGFINFVNTITNYKLAFPEQEELVNNIKKLAQRIQEIGDECTLLRNEREKYRLSLQEKKQENENVIIKNETENLEDSYFKLNNNEYEQQQTNAVEKFKEEHKNLFDDLKDLNYEITQLQNSIGIQENLGGDEEKLNELKVQLSQKQEGKNKVIGEIKQKRDDIEINGTISLNNKLLFGDEELDEN